MFFLGSGGKTGQHRLVLGRKIRVWKFHLIAEKLEKVAQLVVLPLVRPQNQDQAHICLNLHASAQPRQFYEQPLKLKKITRNLKI